MDQLIELRRHRKEKMKRILQHIMNTTIIPTTYLLGMWLAMVAIAFLFTEDLTKGAGIASALGLFYIMRGYYTAELYRAQVGERIEDAKSDEEKG